MAFWACAATVAILATLSGMGVIHGMGIIQNGMSPLAIHLLFALSGAIICRLVVTSYPDARVLEQDITDADAARTKANKEFIKDQQAIEYCEGKHKSFFNFAPFNNKGKKGREKAEANAELKKGGMPALGDGEILNMLTSQSSLTAPADSLDKGTGVDRRRMASKALPRLLEAINEENSETK